MSSSPQGCSEMEIDQGDSAAKLSKSERHRKGERKLLKTKLHASPVSFDKREDVGSPKSKPECSRGLGTAANVDQMNTVLSTAATSDMKSLISRSEGDREIADNEKGSTRTTAERAKRRSKRQEYVETANDLKSSSRNTTLDATGSHDVKGTLIKREQHLTIGSDEVGSSETASIARNTRSKRKKYVEIASDDTVSAKLATSDAKKVSKGEGYTIVAAGELGPITTSNVNVADIIENKKRKIKENKPTSVESSNPSPLKDMDTAIDETCPGTTTPDNGTSKKGRRKKREKKQDMNPASGDILSTRESMQDNVIAKEGSSTTKALELRSFEMVSGKTEIPDAKMVPEGEELTEFMNGKMGSSSTTIDDANGTVIEQKKKKSKNKRLTTGEIMNPKCSQDKGTANSETVSVAVVTEDSDFNVNGTVKEKKKEKSKNMGPATDEVMDLNCLQDKETANGETVSVAIETEDSDFNVNGTVKEKKKKSKNKGQTTGEIRNPKCLQDEETVSGETASVAIVKEDSVFNVNDTVKEKKKQKSKNKGPTTGEMMSPKLLQDKETANGETVSVVMVIDDSASRKKRGQKGLEEKKAVSGDISSAAESTHDEVIMKTDLNTDNLLEARITNLKEDYLKTENVDTGSVTIGTDDAAPKKTKKRKGARCKNNKPGSGDMVSNAENTPDAVITKNDSDANNVSETKCTYSKEEDCLKIVNGEDCMVIAKEDSDINKVLEAKTIDSKVEDYPKTAKGDTGSVTVVTDGTPSKRKKRRRGEKLKNNESASDVMLSNVENTPDTVITKNDSDANNVSELKCTYSKEDDCLKTVNGEECMVIAKEDSDINKVLEAKSTDSKVEDYPRTAKGNMGSVTVVTDGTPSKKKKRKRGERFKNNESASGDYPKIINGEECLITTVLDNQTMDNAHEDTELLAANEIPHVATSTKKLLIFDVNGLLADVVFNRPKDVKADAYREDRAIFKRPFLDDFLRFCFERFDIGIWSSRSRRVLDPVVDYLFKALKDKLVFLWDASHCTKTHTPTLENKHKFIVFKDLRKVWQKNDRDGPWVKGTYDESNTLLLDDSPYKALLNPKHTGVFPVSYTYLDKNDVSLGPNGDLRTYLEGLAGADDMRTYVEQHPFGQGAIDETNADWAFYSKVVGSYV